MKVITRHLTKEILQATSFVLLAIVALFAFFDLVRQMERIGSRYSLLDAFVITGLNLPMRIYEVMPIAALLATVFVMSQVSLLPRPQMLSLANTVQQHSTQR